MCGHRHKGTRIMKANMSPRQNNKNSLEIDTNVKETYEMSIGCNMKMCLSQNALHMSWAQ
jgi:hypothetical protein